MKIKVEMLPPHIIASLRAEQHLANANALSMRGFQERDGEDEDRESEDGPHVRPAHTYLAPGQSTEFSGVSCFSIAAPESARVFHFEMGCEDDDSE
ncbi:MAG TPA: hypothetical protein VN176_18350 [Verrucomicrobiae bacterium]|jgi:hypothetical protein|nr:hypothetical protein [Verrucomicrobiae bacterium]